MAPVASLTGNQTADKPNKNLPMIKQGQILQPVQQPIGQQATRFAQNAAQPNQTLQAVERKTQNLLNQPEPVISDEFVQSQLGQQTRRQAEAQEQFREQAADTATAPATRAQLADLTFRGAQELSATEQNLKRDQIAANREAMLQDLQLGQDVVRTGEAARTAAFDRLRLGADIGLQERLQTQSEEFQTSFANLQGQIEQGLLQTQQDFQGAQNQLDRLAEKAARQGNEQLTRDIENLRAQLTREGFQSQETVAFANIASDERMQLLDNETRLAITELQGRIQEGLQLNDQDFESIEANLNRQHDLAIQTGDRELALQIENMRDDLARAGLASSEKVAFARITSDERMQLISNELQLELQDIQGRINRDELLTSQSFQAGQNMLDRELQEAINTGNNDLARELEQMQADLAKEMQIADQKFQSAESLANRAWTKSERISQNQFNAAESILDRKFAEAEASKDRELTKRLESDRNRLQLKMQTNDMQHDEKMAYLDNLYTEAQANNDVGRQKDLLSFAHGQEMDKIAKEQGFQRSLVYLQDELETAQRDGDLIRAKELAELQFGQEMQLHQTISAVDQAKLEMQQQGLDITRFESDLASLQAEVEAGRLDPSVLTTYKENVMAASLPEGFQFTEPDPNAVQDALKADYVNQQYQWALTQGDADGDGQLDAGVYDENGRFTGLNDDNFEAFTGHLTSTLYDIEGGDILSNKRIDMKATGEYGELATNDALYQSLIDDVTVPKIEYLPNSKQETNDKWGFVERYKGDGGKARSTFSMFESGGFVNVGGTLLYVDKIDRVSQAGDDDTNYILTNPRTNQTTTITASDRDSHHRMDLSSVGVQSTEFDVN